MLRLAAPSALTLGAMVCGLSAVRVALHTDASNGAFFVSKDHGAVFKPACSESLPEVVIPDTVQVLEGHAFYGCAFLTKVTIPASVKVILPNTFYMCTSLTEVVFAKNSNLEEIGDYAFFGTALQEVIIPASVEDIREYAFSSASLTKVTFAEHGNLEKIGPFAFERAKFLTEVIIPASVEEIERYAFDQCSSLTKVTFAEHGNLAKIGSMAFRKTSVTEVTVPAGAVVDKAAFDVSTIVNVAH